MLQAADAVISVLRARSSLWATAIREGFIALLPLTLLGAIALMLAELVRAGLGAHDEAGSAWPLMTVCHHLFIATIGIMGFASAASIAARASLLLSEGSDLNAPPQISVAFMAGSAFVLRALSSEPPSIQTLGYGQVLEGIAIGILTAEVSHAVAHHLPRPSGLRGLEGHSLLRQALRMCWSAGMVVVIVIAIVWTVSRSTPILATLEQSLAALAEGLPSNSPTLLHALMTTLNQAAWLLGLNGGQLLIEWGGHGILPLADARTAWSSQLAAPMFMNTFGHLGGAGATWGLILATLWRSSDAGVRRLALVSIGPALVNVNEVLLFGLPLVFSRIMLIPFVLVPVFNVCVASGLVELGLMPLNPNASVVWSTPPVLSGIAMTRDGSGGLLQLALVLLDAVFYLPFLRRLEQVRRARMDGQFHASLSVLMGPPRASERLLDRRDAVGDIARRLMEDFTQDLRNGRVQLAYQPQHSASGALTGVEALMRWEHARYGQIPPAAVINVAEECEVIHELGAWVVNQACKDLSAIQRSWGRPLLMSLNMSPVQLESPDGVRQIEQALTWHGVQPGSLDIEITEGRLLSTSAQSEATLSRLQALGVHLSMDDFGMGCTSLLYMQRFKMHAIKLDGALTREILDNRVNQDIVSSVVRLGHAQGVQVIAEFVESPAQRDLLHRLGCDSFQGWLYSKALPLQQLEDYLMASTPPPSAC